MQQKTKKLKGALKKPSAPEVDTVDNQSLPYVEQRDRSLTVMIPRAKYHPAPPTSPLLNITAFEKRKASIASSNETKLLSYLDAGPTPNKVSFRLSMLLILFITKGHTFFIAWSKMEICCARKDYILNQKFENFLITRSRHRISPNSTIFDTKSHD